MADSVRLRVKGSRRFRSDLRRFGKEIPRVLDKSLRDQVNPIAQNARRAYRRRYRRRGAGSQRGIRASGMRVILDGDRYPWLPGQAWGSSRYPQFPPSTRNNRPDERGYFFWPAVVRGRDQAIKNADTAIGRASRRAFPGIR